MNLKILAELLILSARDKIVNWHCRHVDESQIIIFFQEHLSIGCQPLGWEYIDLQLNEIMENRSFRKG